jgi:hypothetical protein
LAKEAFTSGDTADKPPLFFWCRSQNGERAQPQKRIRQEQNRTSNYQGRHSHRSELRHLRWMGLLAMKRGRIIGDIRDNLTGDLTDYVYLTPNGKEWVQVLGAAGGGGC